MISPNSAAVYQRRQCQLLEALPDRAFKCTHITRLAGCLKEIMTSCTWVFFFSCPRVFLLPFSLPMHTPTITPLSGTFVGEQSLETACLYHNSRVGEVAGGENPSSPPPLPQSTADTYLSCLIPSFGSVPGPAVKGTPHACKGPLVTPMTKLSLTRASYEGLTIHDNMEVPVQDPTLS